MQTINLKFAALYAKYPLLKFIYVKQYNVPFFLAKVALAVVVVKSEIFWFMILTLLFGILFALNDIFVIKYLRKHATLFSRHIIFGHLFIDLMFLSSIILAIYLPKAQSR